MALSRYAARLAAPQVECALPISALPLHRLKKPAQTRPSTSDFGNSTSTALEHEAEDASLTGGTRSLSRRLLALNIPVSASRPVAKAPGRRKVSLIPQVPVSSARTFPSASR